MCLPQPTRCWSRYLLSTPFGMTCTLADGLYRRTLRTVGLVEHYDVPVEAQSESLDKEKGEPVSGPHLLAAEALGETHHPSAREKRQEAGRKRRGEALDPQVVRYPPGRERQQRVEQQLPAARTGPADWQLPVRTPLRTSVSRRRPVVTTVT